MIPSILNACNRRKEYFRSYFFFFDIISILSQTSMFWLWPVLFITNINFNTNKKFFFIISVLT